MARPLDRRSAVDAGNTSIKQWYLNADGIGGAARPGNGAHRFIAADDRPRWRRILHHLARQGICRATSCATMQGSLTFDSPELVTAMDIVGAARGRTRLSVDKPVASIAVRLNDVWPTGEVSRITYGLLNLDPSRQPRVPDAARARQALQGEGQARRHRHAHPGGSPLARFDLDQLLAA